MEGLDWNYLVGGAELLVLMVFAFLIYKWNTETTFTALNKTEGEVKQEYTLEEQIEQMIATVDLEVGEVQRTPHGLLKRDSLLAIQRIVVYFNTRAMLHI